MQSEGNVPVRRWMTILAGLILVVGIGVLWISGGKTILGMTGTFVTPQEAPRYVQRFAVPKARSLQLNDFVIPFAKSGTFTYASLNISFSLKNEEVWAEMINKKTWLRAIIYDRLSQEINRSGEMPALEKLKRLIMEEINRSLTSGKINEVYVTDILLI